MTGAGRHARREGFAVLTVLLVLMALFVMVAPFLTTVRNADHASAELTDRSAARLALDSAGRHARSVLRASHPALDPTPYSDSLEELAVAVELPEGFLDPADAKGVMWDLEAADVAGRIDVNSASPQVIGNLTGLATVAARPVTDELRVTGTASFPETGVLRVRGELIGYTSVDRASFGGLERGLLAAADSGGDTLECGPQPASSHPAGTPVLEQQAWALAEWRVAFGDAEPARLDTFDRIVEAEPFAMASQFAPDFVERVRAGCTVWGEERAGPRWQRPSRLANDLRAGESCVLRLDDARFFNAGTTVQITQGETSELGLVLDNRSGREVVLTAAVANDYTAYRAEVRPLARRPVNVNTAPAHVLRALFTYVHLRGVNDRVTPGEARQLTEVILESRPFDGFRDFLERVLFPAAGIEPLPADAPVVPRVFAEAAGGVQSSEEVFSFLAREDAAALYLNALNANDRLLGFATMPLSFVSRDTYATHLRASVNAPSGVLRVSAARDEVEIVTPQEPLLGVWTRQEDFDLALRLGREAPFWITGPENTSQYAGELSTPASRYAAHFGREDPETGERLKTFASREDDGWAQLEPARVDESRDLLRGRVLHFDREETDPEGRDLSQRPVVRDTSERELGWRPSGADAYLQPLRLSAWIRPLGDLRAMQGALFADVGATSRVTDADEWADRVSLLVDGDDLVLRVADGAGDHSRTDGFREHGEVRYAVAGEDVAGLPAETWSHVEIDVRGNRPSQMAMTVDGRLAGRTMGLTRLTQGLSPGETDLRVESTEGFPERCVLRVGDEIIEARVAGPDFFDATPGADTAGRGGRLARERVFYDGAIGIEEPNYQAAGIANGKLEDHPRGTAVELYGYSIPIAGAVTGHSDRLPERLGPFRAARVAGVLDDDGDDRLEPINGELQGFGWQIGRGFHSTRITGIVLGPADLRFDSETSQEYERFVEEELMPAFNPRGGYAAILQEEFSFPLTVSIGGITYTGIVDSATSEGGSVPLGGVEIVYYSGIQDDALLIEERGIGVPVVAGHRFPNESSSPRPIEGRKAFVVDWAWNSWNGDLASDVFVIPISIPASSAGPAGFLDPEALAGGRSPRPYHSEFAQILPADPLGDAELTEWVRYDEIDTARDQLVRSDPRYLWLAIRMATSFTVALGGVSPDEGEIELDPPPTLTPDDDDDDDDGPGGAGTPPGGPPPPLQRANYGYWSPYLGEREFEYEGEPLIFSRAVSDVLQFRGVFGTHSHRHEAGDLVTPVFRLDLGVERGPNEAQDTTVAATPFVLNLVARDVGTEDVGWPGRLDQAFLMGVSSDVLNSAGTEVTLQHVHRPLQFVQYEWDENPTDTGIPLDGNDRLAPYQLEELRDFIYFSLDGPGPASPLFETDAQGVTAADDVRLLPRLTLFPSGELPRAADSLTLGGRYDRPGQGAPLALVDEVVFGNSTYAGSGSAGAPTAGAALVLAAPLDEEGGTADVRPGRLRRARAYVASSGATPQLPARGGLLRIGEEVVCFESASGANVFLASVGGRGLLGTEPQPHQPGESVVFLEGWTVSTLAADITAESNGLALVALDGFPPRGTVLVDDELIHYTRIWGGALEMPQASTEPGRKDGEGPGLFRGRYGTRPGGHAAGTPVIFFPFRYWDRWTEHADAPELSYFGFSHSQPGALWNGVFWQEEETQHAGPHLGVLQRTDPAVPWDADPNRTPGLDLLLEGMPEGAANAIAAASDRIEWRVFVRYEPGSFDALDGLAHGWKTTPALRLFGVDYLAPNVKLWSVER